MILRDIYPARPADPTDFSDLTASVQTGPAYWLEGEVDTLVVPFDVEPTPAEAAAIRRRLITADAEEEARVKQLEADAANPATPSWAKPLMRAELDRYTKPRPQEPPVRSGPAE